MVSIVYHRKGEEGIRNAYFVQCHSNNGVENPVWINMGGTGQRIYYRDTRARSIGPLPATAATYPFSTLQRQRIHFYFCWKAHTLEIASPEKQFHHLGNCIQHVLQCRFTCLLIGS